jgi:hypothetical protein
MWLILGLQSDCLIHCDFTGDRLIGKNSLLCDRREEISSVQAYQFYRQRFDLEHTFRFQKRKLLLNGFEIPEVEHEEQWIDASITANLGPQQGEPFRTAARAKTPARPGTER